MDRRQFVGLTSAATAAWLAEQRVNATASAQPTARRAPTPPKALMKVGTQHGDSDAILRVLRRLRRQSYLQPACPRRTFDAAWSVEGLTRLRERVESFGITLDMVPLPLSSSEISRSENPAILLGRIRIATGRSTTSAR